MTDPMTVPTLGGPMKEQDELACYQQGRADQAKEPHP